MNQLAGCALHLPEPRFLLRFLLACSLAGSLWSTTAYGQGQSVSSVVPAPNSTVSNLTQITVVFIQPVLGVRAQDLILSGASALSVNGSGAAYTFSFTPPTPGLVEASWNGGHNITDVLGNRLNDLTANTLWHYTLLDKVTPKVVALSPPAGAALSHLTQLNVTFSEAVGGVDAADLLINDQPASQVSGAGAGPYTFTFASPIPGAVQLSWLPNHGIHDLSASANSFAGGTWGYTLHPGEFAGDILINEFLAVNSHTNGLRDEDGDLEDWIELFNRGPSPVNLNGWTLSDQASQPDQWVFPSVTLGPGEYLVVFASGKDRRPEGGAGNLHTNFKLSGNGQYLGLFNANLPRQVATQFLPGYPEQRADLAYGLYGGTFGYLTNPTPAAANSGPASFSGVAAEPHASVGSGFFGAPFTLVLSSATPGAAVRYTLDGSEPTALNGQLYNSPISVVGTPGRAMVMVRAAAFRADLLSSRIVTHSYLFPEFVLAQPANPIGFPTSWITQTNEGLPEPTVVPADYEMDPRIVTNAAYAPLAVQGLTNLPTLSIVTETDNLFSQNSGIYSNPKPLDAERLEWERPASVELLMPDGSAGFHLNAGLRIQGGTSRDPNTTRKHSFRLFFREDYDGKLNYSLFPDSPASSFKTFVLKAGFNLTWNNRYEVGGARAQFVRDQFCSDLQATMNHATSHGRFVNLYLNGLYWGLFNLHERPDEDFAATYLGGDNSEYDVVRNTDGFFELVSGTTNAWTEMMALVNGGLSENSQYEQLLQYLDVDSFIDYMMINHYAGNTDWANHNWYAIRRRVPGAGYQFISWDAEITMKSVTENVTGYNQTWTPTMIHSFLRNNLEYRLKFGDHVYKQFFNGGPLFVDTNSPAIDPANPQLNRPGAFYIQRIQEIAPAVVLESARWGDSPPSRLNNPFTLNDFLTELSWITNTYLPQRSVVVLGQYRTQMMYPGIGNVDPPAFNRAGGDVAPGFGLVMSAPLGTVYFTTNGADPRVYGSGAVTPGALAYSGPFPITSTMTIKARALSGGNWSPLNEATFSVAQLLLPLRFTEIMYQPVGGDPYQFLELQNLGPTPLMVGRWIVSGISFTFPIGFTIAPGAVIVLASDLNSAAFAARYPGLTVAAYFNGKLAKNGERLAIEDIQGRTIVALNYSKTNGWPVPTDGLSIEINDPAAEADDPANWRLSSVLHGTPGNLTLPPPLNGVRFNEVQALSGTNADWIELFNPGPNATNLAGWSLSNDGNPRKFVFPSATVTTGNYLVVICDNLTNGPGLHTGFTLGGQGEHLFLYDPQSRLMDALSFGPQLTNFTLGRVAGDWQLTLPTPNAVNQLAALGGPGGLVINEWLANAAPGQDDWLELYNASSQPVALRGLYLGLSNALFRISVPAFIAPGGYVQWLADEEPGPNHLDFKLPAEGDSLVLRDPFGAELNRVAYGPQLDGVSQGRLPDGSANIVNFPGSASPGTTNFVVSFAGVRLNEVMARNDAAVVDPWGGHADWVELYNPGAAMSLAGMSLSLDQMEPGQWVFPPGTTLAAGSYLTVWCDSSRPATTNLVPNFNTGHALDGNSGAAYLFNASGQVVDYLEYGSQISDRSLGRVGSTWRLLSTPTPGTANAGAATLGSVANLRFNEWMAQPLAGDDWFEFYNLDNQPVDLGGLYLSDDPSLAGQTRFQVPPLSFVEGHGWMVWQADGHPSQGRNHVNFQLDSRGETLRLYATNLSLLDEVAFGVQQAGVSEGWLPEGADVLVRFATSPSPGGANYLPLTNVVINEVLSHADPPLEDAIELANLGPLPVDLSGWYLSDQQSALQKFRIPDGTVLGPYGYKVFYQYQFDPNPGVFPSFSLDSAHGDQLYLSAAAGGVLNGYRTGVEFGAAQNGVSFGRYTNSTGVEFVALSQRSFGMDNPATLAQFRMGTGLANAYPKVQPVVLNELMYHPVTVVGTNLVENAEEEFVELYNLTGTNVALYDPAVPADTWRLRGAVEFSFPSGLSLGPQSYAVVVGFDPGTNAVALGAFRARYGLSTNIPVWGPWSGRLRNEGESLELYKPDAPSPAPSAGYVPLILVDRVNYLPGAPWPTAADGGGASLQRRVPSLFGNDPLNWKSDAPTAGRTNQPVGIIPPVITSQPQSQTIIAGGSIALSVSVAGTLPLTYQWQRDGVALPGATNSAQTMFDVQPSDSGAYRVWVANAAGEMYSKAATVAVSQPPVIIVQPVSVTAAEGASAALHVTASGTAPLAYQWYFNNSEVVGGTDSSLVFAQVEALQSGAYRVVVTNSVGVAASALATLTVTGTDSDGDGISDAWMIQNFGHPNGWAGDRSRAQDDADDDGMSNLQEYLAGTNPLDPESTLKLQTQGLDPITHRPRMSFIAVAGVGYTLQYSDRLAPANWRRLRDIGPDPITQVFAINDPEGAPRRFYRLVTPIQPFTDSDSDGDGIPDSWLIKYFGHPTGAAGDQSRAQDDADRDGMNNLREYLSGTDPLDSQSVLSLRMAGLNTFTGRPQFEFTAVAGFAYTLQYRNNLSTGVWQKLRDIPAELSNRDVSLDDFDAANAGTRFYRVVTPTQP